MQNHHSLVYREEEREMFPTLNHFGVGIIPWSPLARGLLTRPFKGDTRTARGDTDWCVRLFPLGLFYNLTPSFLQVLRWLYGRTRHRGNC
jgi:aryl-alcohol dehydrogenase-like predicted oxidoreductase